MVSLHYAVKHYRYEAARRLIEHGADVNGMKCPMSLLHIAVHNNDTTMTRLLLKNGAECECSLIHIAIRYRNVTIVALLYEHTAEVITCHDIELALKSGNIGIIEIIAKHSDQHTKNTMFDMANDMQVDISIINSLLQLGATSNKIIENVAIDQESVGNHIHHHVQVSTSLRRAKCQCIIS